MSNLKSLKIIGTLIVICYFCRLQGQVHLQGHPGQPGDSVIETLGHSQDYPERFPGNPPQALYCVKINFVLWNDSFENIDLTSSLISSWYELDGDVFVGIVEIVQRLVKIRKD